MHKPVKLKSYFKPHSASEPDLKYAVKILTINQVERLLSSHYGLLRDMGHIGVCFLIRLLQ